MSRMVQRSQVHTLMGNRRVNDLLWQMPKVSISESLSLTLKCSEAPFYRLVHVPTMMHLFVELLQEMENSNKHESTLSHHCSKF